MNKFLYVAASIFLLSCGEESKTQEELSSYREEFCVREVQRYEYMGEERESEVWLIRLEGVAPGELEVLWMCYEMNEGFFMCEEPLSISYSLASDETLIICNTLSGVYNDSYSNSYEEIEERDKNKYVLFWKRI